uniref:Uncharacterized protein n=1 Tax=Riptortus pedestris TaxID=329032 RepID=R4WD71_RIPPE|nr:unknown secreted protein [Riptortus pedestris]
MKKLLQKGCLIYLFLITCSSTFDLDEKVNGLSRITTGSSTITDETIKKLLAKISQMVGTSYDLSYEAVSWDKDELTLNGSIANTTIKDPSSFTTNTAHVNMSTLEFEVGISYKTLSILGHYDLYCDNEYIHLTGSDLFSIDIKDLDAKLYLKLKLNEEKKIRADDLSIDYNMVMKVDIKDLGHNKKVSDTLNELINYLLPSVITSTKEKVSEQVKAIALPKMQFLFNDMTLEQLILFINSIVDS